MMGGAAHRRIAGWVALGLALSPADLVRAAPRAGPAECRASPARAETLDGVGPRGELRFASGARAVLDSLRWPDGEPEAGAASLRLEARRGARLTVVPRGEPDRWGRERVDAQVEDGATTDRPTGQGPPGDDADLAGDLIGAGLGFADPGEADALCRPALLAVEAGARGRRLGLWRAPLPAAADGAALRALAGRFAVVEGVVRHVGERPARTYLDFAARGEDGLTVTVTKRTWRTMRARGLSADGLLGRRVRVRGVLEVRRGPTLEATADGVEVLGEAPEEPPGASGRPGAEGERGLRR